MIFTPFAYRQQATQGIVTTNLALWYEAGNTSSYPGTGTSWSNLQPTTLTSTLTNGPTYSTGNGGNIVFDGTNDYTTGPNDAIFDFGTGDFTIEMWVQINGNSSANSVSLRSATLISCFPTSGSITTAWGLELVGSTAATGTGLAFVKYGGGNQNVSLTYSFTKAQYYQLGISHSGGVTKYFVNGVEYAASANLSGAVNSGGYSVRIAGLLYSGFVQYFNGAVGIVRVYKGTGLNAQQILQNYNANSANIVPTIVNSGLQLYLDAGLTQSYPAGGTTWIDLTSNGNNLTLVNGPTWSSSDGGYFTFDGTNDYVSNYSYTNQFTSNNFTYCGVLRYDNKSNSYHNIFDRYNSVNPMLWVNTASKLEADQAAGYTSTLSYTGQTIMVTMTHSNTAGEGVKLYVNGTYLGGNTAAQGAITGNGRFSLYRRETSGNYYKGRGYNLMIYNKVLTESEILQNYNALKSRYGI